PGAAPNYPPGPPIPPALPRDGRVVPPEPLHARPEPTTPDTVRLPRDILPLTHSQRRAPPIPLFSSSDTPAGSHRVSQRPFVTAPAGGGVVASVSGAAAVVDIDDGEAVVVKYRMSGSRRAGAPPSDPVHGPAGDPERRRPSPLPGRRGQPRPAPAGGHASGREVRAASRPEPRTARQPPARRTGLGTGAWSA